MGAAYSTADVAGYFAEAQRRISKVEELLSEGIPQGITKRISDAIERSGVTLRYGDHTAEGLAELRRILDDVHNSLGSARKACDLGAEAVTSVVRHATGSSRSLML